MVAEIGLKILLMGSNWNDPSDEMQHDHRHGYNWLVEWLADWLSGQLAAGIHFIAVAVMAVTMTQTGN